MAHVRDDEWVDFVRGTLAADRAASVAAHLKGCGRCLKTQALWQAVVQTAGREYMYAPPNDTVRVARSRFIPARQQPAWTPVRAALVFDSLREAHAAGVRGAAAIPRHLLYQAGPLSVDLRVEPIAGSVRMTLIGQVADAGRPAARAGKCRIALLDGDRQLGSTSTNRFGEFELQVAAHENLALLVTVKDRQPVCVQISEVLDGC